MNKCYLLLVNCGLALTACAGASVFYQDAQGGILVVSGSEEGKMAAARERIEAHCGPQGYVITRRFTVVVGSESYSQTNYQDIATEDKTKVESAEAQAEGETRQTRRGSKDRSRASESSVSKEASSKVSTGEEVSTSTTRDVTEHRVAYRCGQ